MSQCPHRSPESSHAGTAISHRHSETGECGVRRGGRDHVRMTFVTVRYDCPALTSAIIDISLCLIYKSHLTIGTTCRKIQYRQGSALSTVSGAHWGSWNVSPRERGPAVVNDQPLTAVHPSLILEGGQIHPAVPYPFSSLQRLLTFPSARLTLSSS